MKIEEETGPGAFSNEHHKLRVNLLFTANWLKAHVRSFLDPFNLTQPQYNTLRILRNHYPQPLTTLQITDEMIDRHADTSRIVERLRKKGWVMKKTCGTDKRRVDVMITHQGLTLMQKIDQQFSQMDAFTAHLSTEKIDQLNELLDQLRACD